MTRENPKAALVASVDEVRQEQFAALVVFGNGDGRGLSITDASRAMGINPRTGQAWWRTKLVQDYVRENLDTARNAARLSAAKHAEHAIQTLVNATNSPAYTTPQVNAAKALLTFAFGEKEAAQTSVGLQVVVNTGLPEGTMAQQQRRHGKKEQTTDGEFTVLPVE